MAQNEKLRWFALRVLPQREDMAAKVLRRDGLIAEVKTEQKLRRRTKWDKERRYITFNAAPSYCFIAVPGFADPRAFVRPLHIFRSFVGLNGVPAELGEGAMRKFLEMEDGQLPGYFRYHKTGREFSIGETVIINTGPFRDQQLRVDDIQDGEACFFVPMLGQTYTVRVPVNDCIAAEAA